MACAPAYITAQAAMSVHCAVQAEAAGRERHRGRAEHLRMESRRCCLVSLVSGLCLLLLLPCSAMAQPLAPASFVFGDSLADPGNNNYIRTLSKADSPPNGIDFPGRKATGRYCNGRTTVDIIGQMMGLTSFTPAYLDPTTRGPAILNGVNYASGAAGILDSSGYIFYGRIPLNKQLEYFANTKAQLVQLLGEQGTADLLAKSLFTSNFGSNDYLNNYYQPFSPVGNLTSDQLSALLIYTYRGQLTQMYTMGARKVVVAALGPLGCIPYQLTLRLRQNGECDERVNQQVQTFNRGVLGLVNELNAHLPGAKFIYIDAYKAVSEMVADPQGHGFKVVDVGCCGAGGTYKGIIPCLPNMTICPDRFDYLFWDPYHPTDKANVMLTQKFFDGTGYATPMNIRQLLLS